MMKRILCFVLCLVMAAGLVFAETMDTLSDKFERQLIIKEKILYSKSSSSSDSSPISAFTV